MSSSDFFYEHKRSYGQNNKDYSLSLSVSFRSSPRGFVGREGEGKEISIYGLREKEQEDIRNKRREISVELSINSIVSPFCQHFIKKNFL